MSIIHPYTLVWKSNEPAVEWRQTADTVSCRVRENVDTPPLSTIRAVGYVAIDGTDWKTMEGLKSMNISRSTATRPSAIGLGVEIQYRFILSGVRRK